MIGQVRARRRTHHFRYRIYIYALEWPDHEPLSFRPRGVCTRLPVVCRAVGMWDPQSCQRCERCHIAQRLISADRLYSHICDYADLNRAKSGKRRNKLEVNCENLTSDHGTPSKILVRPSRAFSGSSGPDQLINCFSGSSGPDQAAPADDACWPAPAAGPRGDADGTEWAIAQLTSNMYMYCHTYHRWLQLHA